MDNPAQALLDLMDEWIGPGNHTPESHRGVRDGDDPGLWQIQNKAVGLLIEIEQAMEEMETLDPEDDLSAFREELVDVYQAVYGYRPVWGSAVGGTANPVPVLKDRKPLQRLASLIRKHRRLAGVSGGDREQLRTALAQALDELDRADYLRAEVRAYLIVLIRRTLKLVDDDTSTDGRVRSAAHETAGALVAVEETTGVPAEDKPRWRELANQVATAVVVKTATDGAQSAVGQLGKAAKQLLLGDGN